MWAVTAIVPEQLAGASIAEVRASLPVATTMAAPSARAAVIALCCAVVQVVLPPRLRLITLAGVALVATPGTVPPAAQVMASMMSELAPPHLPSARAICTLTPGATPATPMALCWAAIWPVTKVPCQLLSVAEVPQKLG